MRRAFASAVGALVACSAITSVTASKPEELVECPVSTNLRGHENTEWSISYAYDLVEEKKDLPRVLLIGDSICNGYKDEVRRLLDGQMTVSYWISSYCVTSPGYLRLLSFYLDEAKYEVIHFNNGLHSLQTADGDYEKGVRAALGLIRAKQPKARVILATSTPLRDAAKTAKAKSLNSVAVNVASEFKDIAIDDLFAAMDPLDREESWSDTYHFTAGAKVRQGEIVANAVLPGRKDVRNLHMTTGPGGRPVPKPALLDRIHEGIDVYGIVHWGLNTYTDREWGYGDEDPRLLDPEAFDADQIVSACKDGGLQGLVVVAKHHDGFCLWPTRTTEHNITKSPFRGGKGDYVREMADACRRHGMKFGVYVSPWDRNSADYGTAKYVETYHAQIKELLGGNYGEVFEMWFDGANGGDGYYGGAREKRIIPGGYYRFGDVFKFVRELQPKVCIFAGESDASDLRWPGNERGELDPDSRATIVSVGGFSKGEYGNSDYRYLISSGIPSGRFFRMCEADFPLRRGWFHHEKDKGLTKHAAYLMKCYLRTVGNGGMMNLGIAPNKCGRLDEEDVKALNGFGTIKNAFFAHEVIGDGKPFNVIVLEEDVSGGEQVDHWHLFDGETKCLASGRAIGRRRIRVFDKEIVPDRLNLRIGSAGPGLGQVSLRRYRVDPELIGLVMDSSVSSGETDTARWMTGAGNEKEETGK